MEIEGLKALAEDRDKKRIIFELQFKSSELELQMLRLSLMSAYPQYYDQDLKPVFPHLQELARRIETDYKLFTGEDYERDKKDM